VWGDDTWTRTTLLVAYFVLAALAAIIIGIGFALWHYL
jgi:hypothetical protein